MYVLVCFFLEASRYVDDYAGVLKECFELDSLAKYFVPLVVVFFATIIVLIFKICQK